MYFDAHNNRVDKPGNFLMAQYYKSDKKSKSDAYVKDIQAKLNAIRLQYHGNWEYLVPDGIYGPKTSNAVKSFQIFKNITPASGELGPTTSMYIYQLYNNQPQLKATPYHENEQQDNELGEVVMNYFCRPTLKMVVELLSNLQKDYPKNSKQFVKDWNLIVNKIRTRFLQLLSKFDTNKNSAYDQISRYWEKKKALSPNRKNKLRKNSQNIERLLDKHLGPSHVKLDYNRVFNKLKVRKVISGAGNVLRISEKVDLYMALWEITDDINNINDSASWMSKWTRDINSLIDVLIDLIIGAIVVLLLPEEMALILVCLIVGAVGILVTWLLDCFHKTYIGRKFDATVGDETAKFLRSWQNEMSDIKTKNRMAEEEWMGSQGTVTIKLF